MQNRATIHLFAVNRISEPHQVNGNLSVFYMENIVFKISFFHILHQKTPSIALNIYAKHCINMQKQPQKRPFSHMSNVKFFANI